MKLCHRYGYIHDVRDETNQQIREFIEIDRSVRSSENNGDQFIRHVVATGAMSYDHAALDWPGAGPVRSGHVATPLVRMLVREFLERRRYYHRQNEI